MSAVEHWTAVASRLLPHLRKDPPMTTATPTRAPTGHPCKNCPDEPATVTLIDGTHRCEECHQEPRVTAWSTAHAEYFYPGCHSTVIRPGDTVATLDTVPPQRVCKGCIE